MFFAVLKTEGVTEEFVCKKSIFHLHLAKKM